MPKPISRRSSMAGKTGSADDRRLTVALTFDFDAESYWLGVAKVASPSAVSRGTYGATEGVPRILKLLSKYDLPATFFIPGYTADRHPDVIRSITDAGHEIGHHGYLHEPPNLLNLEEERTMIERGIESLERVVGKKPRGYRSPSAELSKATYSLLTEYGFEYDSSQFGADRPYWVEDNGVRTNIVEIPIAVELTDSCHFMFLYQPIVLPGLSAPSKVEEIWRGDFDGAYEEGGDCCYLLTMHPQIIGRHHRMQMVERLIRHMLKHDGVWFAQMGEIADDFRKRKSVR
jgi:peptidoglycan/xylan/chitin deacetylase (PgdA/CDA1 family)